mmetsp:Transcript_30982/g.75255  ORF Transcript_30982/g.75255 Transcript_30982/m.75255 type:complete len:247 (-) Transcript_30982:61-801(-)
MVRAHSPSSPSSHSAGLSDGVAFAAAAFARGGLTSRGLPSANLLRLLEETCRSPPSRTATDDSSFPFASFARRLGAPPFAASNSSVGVAALDEAGEQLFALPTLAFASAASRSFLARLSSSDSSSEDVSVTPPSDGSARRTAFAGRSLALPRGARPASAAAQVRLCALRRCAASNTTRSCGVRHDWKRGSGCMWQYHRASLSMAPPPAAAASRRHLPHASHCRSSAFRLASVATLPVARGGLCAFF